MEDNLRPISLDDYIGQNSLKENLKVYIESAKKRCVPLSHTIIHGPAGLGKTSLASVIASEYGSRIVFSNAANIEKAGDLLKYFIELEEGDFLFIDEIHRLDKKVEENLYTAMEDYRVDIKHKSGMTEKPVSITLEPFTLIGATTMKGKMSTPLIDRFGINLHLSPYSDEELIQIIIKNSNKLNFEITKDAAYEIAIRSRGTPRKSNHIIKRVLDFLTIDDIKSADKNFVMNVLMKLKIDEYGLEEIDRKILSVMDGVLSKRPVGIQHLSSTTGESRETIESDIEPYLLQKGLIERTPRGRIITDLGKKVLSDY